MRVFRLLLPFLLLTGCSVKFDYFGSLGSVQLITPAPNSHLPANSIISATGTCNPNGQTVVLSGSLVGLNVYNTSCLANGTFNENITITTSGNGYFLNVTQSSNGQILSYDALNISTHDHCGSIAMQACAASGTGNPSDPYGISNISCLQEIQSSLSCDYELLNNIDATITNTWNSGAGFIPIGSFGNEFTGNFDGQGFRITNLFINYTGGGNVEVGLFGSTSLSTISDVKLINVDIFGNSGGLRGVAAVVGWAQNTTLNRVAVTGQLTGGDNIGSLVGRANNLIINDSYSQANVNELPGVTSRIGGLIGGFSDQVDINNSYYSGTVTSAGVYQVGGLAASFDNAGSINNSFMAGTLTQTSGNAGALLGYAANPVDITNVHWFLYSGLALTVGSGTPNTNDSTSQATVNYFHVQSNAPTDIWDFTNIWNVVDENLPILR